MVVKTYTLTNLMNNVKNGIISYIKINIDFIEDSLEPISYPLIRRIRGWKLNKYCEKINPNPSIELGVVPHSFLSDELKADVYADIFSRNELLSIGAIDENWTKAPVLEEISSILKELGYETNAESFSGDSKGFVRALLSPYNSKKFLEQGCLPWKLRVWGDTIPLRTTEWNGKSAKEKIKTFADEVDNLRQTLLEMYTT